jgi:endonuclease/exonuclease/phosphatase family metal-dependent hydrolase
VAEPLRTLVVPAGSRLRLASYNIHRCLGRDRRHDPDRIAAVIRELDADVIGLQEVSTRLGGEPAIDQLVHLARATGYEAVAGPTLRFAAGHCGNALLVRGGVRSVAHLDLSLPRREPRALLDVEIECGGTSVRVIVTHLGLLGLDRRAQVRRLLQHLGDDRDRLLVMLGDFNEWFPQAATLRRLRARLGRSLAVRTFPAWRPLLALDRIWAQPGEALTDVRAHATPLAREASDHLPVRGTLMLPTT